MMIYLLVFGNPCVESGERIRDQILLVTRQNRNRHITKRLSVNISTSTSGIKRSNPIVIALRLTVIFYKQRICFGWVNTKLYKESGIHKLTIAAIVKVVATSTCACPRKNNIIW